MDSHRVVEEPLMVPNSPAALAFYHPHFLLPVVWGSLLCRLNTATPFPSPSGHHPLPLPYLTYLLCEPATLQSLMRPAGVSIPAQRVSRLWRVEQSSVLPPLVHDAASRS